GTVISYWDLSEHYRRQDIRFVEVASSNTPEKRGYNFHNPSPADLKKIDEEILVPHSERFQNWVRTMRPNVNEDTLTGKMYYADQALENGLADSIGTFNEALQLVQQLSQSDMFKSKKPKTEAPKAAATVPAPVAEESNQETTSDAVSREEFEALQTQMQETQQNQQTMLTQLKTMTGVLERLAQLPANEVADPKGDEGVATSDQQVAPVEFGDFYEENRQAYKAQTGLQ
ncbi:MAG: S49 family peptidase, partial [Bacteroidota bacterium]